MLSGKTCNVPMIIIFITVLSKGVYLATVITVIKCCGCGCCCSITTKTIIFSNSEGVGDAVMHHNCDINANIRSV